MKTLLSLFAFLVSVNSFSQDFTESSEAKKRSPHNWRFAAHANYFNLNDQLDYFEVDRNFGWGASLGRSYNWNISSLNSIRLEPYYLFQKIDNRFEQDNVIIQSSFNNHIAGMDFFPLVLKTKNKFHPTLSLGGYAQYIVHNTSNSKIMDQDINYLFEEINSFQYGWILGAGVNLNGTLLELRLSNSMVQYYENSAVSNNIRSISFILAF